MRVYNFSAGPAMLPLEVLERAKDELLDWAGTGMSVMEHSHRGKAYVERAAAVEASLREVMGVPDNYKCLFLQGGAYGEFAALPLNLSAAGQSIDFINTGDWSTKAIAEAKKYAVPNVIASTKEGGFTDVPDADSFTVNPDSAYLHYTPNETIRGVEFDYIPDSKGLPLIADFSSTILSRPINVTDFDVIFAGAQKNMGPSGLVTVIVKDDLLGKARVECPSVWDYTQQAAADSMLNTPNTFGWYLLGLVLDWVKDNGGLEGMGQRNKAKADVLYDYIDGSGYWTNPVAKRARSWMNIPFLQPNAELDKQFVSEAAKAGLTNLAGHRSVGGMRASIYNAVPLEGVQALVEFMKEFAQKNG
ncbi:3-phosphoserine/phosphohydroxythreonine transaminase [Propioniciclava tarda]|uniref:3-phosphoserine/phosphohydroxythreonine transaminase n=1 Tax=Propioniciclava tarda TaxID=433330 RepID=UPI00116E53FF|nr:3-phosphoserine/phosphohydroxythreonine transaminase [Propioniciclava tarda]SMO41163.1 phosphoserine aminotransferase apoenzyme [Propioniciclava tarda]